MANKNTKRVQRELHKAGNFSKPVYKRKAKPFPTPNKDEDMSLATQRAIFYGAR